MANKLQVKICGQEYTLVSDESREYMLEMADYINHKMTEVQTRNNRLSTSMAAILVALNVADDLKKKEAAMQEQLDAQKAEIAHLKKRLEQAADAFRQTQARPQTPPQGYRK